MLCRNRKMLNKFGGWKSCPACGVQSVASTAGDKMLAVFEKYYFYLKLSGMDFQGGRRSEVPRITISVVFILFIILATTSVAQNTPEDMDSVLRTVTKIFANGSFAGLYFHLLGKRKQFHALLDELQDITNESMEISFQNYIKAWITLSDSFPGSNKGDTSRAIFQRAAQQINEAIKIISRTTLPVPILYFSPFIEVVYHLCMGKYSIESWHVYYPLWWLSKPTLRFGITILMSVSNPKFRTPLGPDSAISCAFIVVFEATTAQCSLLTACITTIFLVGSRIFVDACLLNIKSILHDVDHMFESKNPEKSILDGCKDAVALHTHLNGYVFALQRKFVHSKFQMFRTDFWNEWPTLRIWSFSCWYRRGRSAYVFRCS